MLSLCCLFPFDSPAGNILFFNRKIPFNISYCSFNWSTGFINFPEIEGFAKETELIKKFLNKLIS